jgi:glycosyltransferase involved in cell wall biosynthesis
MPKLLAITHSTFDPASRFRVMQLLPYFRGAGWTTTHRPIQPSLYWQSPFRNAKLSWATGATVDVLRRLTVRRTCALAGRHDVVLVNRELPMGAELLFRRNQRLIFDFDDALHLGLMPEHFAFMCRNAACSVAGNEMLAAQARIHSPRVKVVPTLVDTDAYTVKEPEPPGAPVRVAWLGSDYSIRETLFPHLDILARAQAVTPFRLVVISRPRPAIVHPTLDWTFLEWSPQVERQVSRHAEIGIMPLQDTPYQQAKCGLKLLEYLAAGLPVIASPVGVNRDILQQSDAGRAASTPDEWANALADLCADRDLRARLGARGRAFCVAHYSVAAWLPRWLAILEEVRNHQL